MVRLSLRLTIGVMSALTVTVVAAVTLALALTSSFSALDAIGTSHAHALVSRASTAADQLFLKMVNPAHSVLEMAAGRRWPWPSDDPATLDTWTWTMKQSYVRVRPYSILSMFFADGTAIITRTSLTNASQYESLVSVPSPYSTTYPNQTEVWNNATAFDGATHGLLSVGPSSFPFVWLRDTPTWSSLIQYVPGSALRPPAGVKYADKTVLFVSMTSRIYRAGDARINANVYGFFIVSLAIGDFSELLRGISATPHTATFAFDDSRLLLGASTTAPIQYSLPLTANLTAEQRVACADTSDAASFGPAGVTHEYACRRNVAEYPNSALRAVARSNPALLAPQVTRVERLKAGGKGYFVGADNVPLPFPGLSVYLLVLMPEKDVLGDVVASRNTAIGITCALVVAVAVVNVGIVWLLLAPLQSVAQRMLDAANLEDDSVDRSLSIMSEVADLQAAYYEMNDELNRIRSFVPQSVLAAKREARRGENETEEEDPDLNNADASYRDDATTDSRRSRRSHRRSEATFARRTTASGSNGESRASGLSATSSTTRPVTVVALNLIGLHTAWHKEGGAAAASEIGAATERVESFVAPRGGVVTFHGDRFLVTFNAVKSCAGHASKAAAAVVGIVSAPSGGPLHLSFSAGIATGTCEVGPMGSATVRSLATVGPAVTHATLLERHCRTTQAAGAGVLATHRTALDASTASRVRFIDLVLLPTAQGGERPTLVAALLPICSAADGMGAGGAHTSAPGDTADDEWMYHLAARDQHAAWNTCFEHVAAGQIGKAVSLYDELSVQPSSNAPDQPAPAPDRLVSMLPVLRKYLGRDQPTVQDFEQVMIEVCSRPQLARPAVP